MAKENDKKNGEDTPVVGEILTNNAMTTEINLTLKSEMDANDLADIIATDAEDELLVKRAEQEKVVRDCGRAFTAAEDQLKELVTGVVDNYKADAESKKLCTALQGFTGAEHAAYAFNATLSVEDKRVKFKVSIQKKQDKKPESYSGTWSVVAKDVEIKASKEIKDQIKAVEAAAHAKTEAQLALNQTNQMLADLPRLRRRAKSNLLKSQLTGQIKTTGDVLEAMQAAKPLALPQPKDD